MFDVDISLCFSTVWPHSVSAPGLGRSSSGLLEPLRCFEQVQGQGQCRGGLVVTEFRATSTVLQLSAAGESMG